MSYTKHRSLFTRPVRLLFALALALAPILGLGSTPAQAASGDCVTDNGTVTCTFTYTGAAETWSVPAGVTSITIQALGAQGARGNDGNAPGAGAAGGNGGAVTATITVTPREALFVYVGGAGVTGGAGGFNGGGAGAAGIAPRASGGGGGASDVRQGGNALANRVVVAGGGGGGGANNGGGAGGAGGGTTGAAGANARDPSLFAHGGGGGTQTAGGAGGTGDIGPDGASGVLGIGGDGGSGGSSSSPGGGGGGGYSGGGGGEANGSRPSSGGGGGGSSFAIGTATGVTHQQGVRTGDGQVIISYSQTDTTAPIITPTVAGTLGANGWYVSDVAVTWSVTDAESTITSENGCDAQSVTIDTSGIPITCSATSVGGSSSQSVTIKRDATAPKISFANRTAPNAAGWNNSPVTVNWTCSDATSGAVSTSVSQTVSGEGTNQSATGTCTDNAGNSATSDVVTLKIDRTPPSVGVTGVTDGASYTVGAVPPAACSTGDTLSGVATQATLSISSGNADGTGNFIATCAGATDLAGNTGSASVIYTVKAATFPATAVLDSFNRANGKVGGSWEGLTESSFYKLASNKLDVQLGGPLVWKSASFGASQEAFVTLSTIDGRSPSQGLLLKVQTGSMPNSRAISVVYDAKAKAVRVSTLRLGQNGAWTLYANKSATFANGDVLGARAKADGTVQIYKNGTLHTTVTLNAADQAFFNAKGGKIGIWTAAASNAILDDFGGGTVNP